MDVIWDVNDGQLFEKSDAENLVNVCCFHLLRQAFVCWTTAVPTTSQGNLETELAWQNTPDTFTEAQYLQHVQTKGLRQVWTGFAHEMQ